MLISCGRCGHVWRVAGAGGTFCPQCFQPVHITLDYGDQAGGADMIEQLQLLCMLTWDGNLISKQSRDDLVKAGLAQRFEGGYNLITSKGVQYLYDLGLLPKRLNGAVKP